MLALIKEFPDRKVAANLTWLKQLLEIGDGSDTASAAALPTSDQPEVPMSRVRVERGLGTATAGETSLRLDLYRAPQTDAPLVLYVHGGGWRGGDKADAEHERLLPLAAYGVTVASVDYRLVPGATFPDQVHDLKGAVRWLRAYGPSLREHRRAARASGVLRRGRVSADCSRSPQVRSSSKALSAATSSSPATCRPLGAAFGQSDLVVSGSRSDIEARLLPFAFEAGLLGVSSMAEATIAPEASASWPESRPRHHPSSSRTATATTSSRHPKAKPCMMR